jgi:meiotically up-regulated gene 157 (Mug157) protein
VTIARLLATLDEFAGEVVRRVRPELPDAAALFPATFRNTLATTVRPQPDGTVHVITGDIPAMWLRDSAAQVAPYLVLARDDPGFAELVAGVVRRQVRHIRHDPYANAFNESPSGARWDPRDRPAASEWVWERKFELDSLCYPVRLAHQLWRATGSTAHIDAEFVSAAALILSVLATERHHEQRSRYRFVRLGEGLDRDGRGGPTAYTGLIWSGFRPSDDPCLLHYHVPANAFAAVTAGHLAEMARAVGNAKLATAAAGLAADLTSAIATHAVVTHARHGRVYAYEIDGLGGRLLADDANIPSLLSLPYLGWCRPDDPLYTATRSLVLSASNPWYHQGSRVNGIGSPHLGEQLYVWPLALIMQALTATSVDERVRVLRVLARSDGGTGLMHEGVHADDPNRFTRPWFGWANSLFAELVLLHAGFPLPAMPQHLLGVTSAGECYAR